MRPYSWFFIFVLVLSSLSFAGCQPRAAAAPTNAPAATQPAATQPAAGYPAEGMMATATVPAYAQPQEPAAGEGDQSNYPYPAQGEATSGPAGVQVVQNRSKVTAKLIEQAPDEKNPGTVKLHVLILSSEKLMGPSDFTAKLVNQEADLYAQAANLPVLKAGDKFEAEVTYNGDERGGRYNADQIKKQE